MSQRLRAYGMLTHHALNELSYAVDDPEVQGCCPKCCAPCDALQILDNEGILDQVVQLWDTFDDGTPVLRPNSPNWWTGSAVDREWLHAAWSANALSCEHSR